MTPSAKTAPRFISRRAFNLLRRMSETSEELTYSKGGGWWLGDDRIAGRDAIELLRTVLIHLAYGNFEQYGSFELNEEARKMLTDPGHRPEILKHLRAAAAR